MRVKIKKIEEKSEEQVIIECVEVTKEVEEIKAYALTKGLTLSGIYKEQLCTFKLEEVLYFEAVDEKVFAYTPELVYELKMRLYQVEEAYRERHFVRCSKSFVINLMCLEGISPALNGRFMAHMNNGEKIIISRQYVQGVKEMVWGGR